MNLNPVPADKALDAHYLEVRSLLLDVAAVLDRIGRGAGARELDSDPRLARIRQALDVLCDREGGRAERVQRIFSLDYDPAWKRPTPG
jgi:hypothetical protein